MAAVDAAAILFGECARLLLVFEVVPVLLAGEARAGLVDALDGSLRVGRVVACKGQAGSVVSRPVVF